MGCTSSTHYQGRVAVLEIAFQCPDVDPALATYLKIGAATTKNINMTASTSDTTSDLSGGFSDSIVTTSALELGVDVVSTVADGALINQTGLFQYYFDAISATPIEQPTVLVRYTWPDLTLVAYMNITDFSRTDPDAETSTASIAFSKAPSPAFPATLSPTV